MKRKLVTAIIGIFAVLAFVCSFTACGSDDDDSQKKPPAKTVTSIAVTTQPTKTVYDIGEALDTTGMVVTATYSDKTTAVVTGWTTSGFSSSTEGTKTITVSYSGKTTTFTVTVSDLSVPPLFDVADWIAAHPDYNAKESSIPSGSGYPALASSPFKMNGSVSLGGSYPNGENWAYGDDGNLMLMIGGDGQGLHIMINGISNEDNEWYNLDMNVLTNLYTLSMDLEVVDWLKNASNEPIDRNGAVVAGTAPTVKLDYRDTSGTIASPKPLEGHVVERTVGYTTSINCDLPAAPGVQSIRFSVNADGAGLIFKITRMVITYNGARPAQDPVVEHFTIGKLEQTEGSVVAVTIEPKTGMTQGAITIKYAGSNTLPTTEGTYAVTFDVAADLPSWNAVTGLAAGNLVIAAGGTVFTPINVFDLGYWIQDPPTTFGSSSSPRPLARASSGCIPEIVTDGSTNVGIKIPVRAETAKYNGLDLFIDATTASASHVTTTSGSAGLDLNCTENKYQVTISGYIIGEPAAGMRIQLEDQNGAGIFKFESGVLTANNQTYTVTGELPANGRETTRIRIKSNNEGYDVEFVVTSIIVMNNGPWGTDTSPLFSLANWIPAHAAQYYSFETSLQSAASTNPHSMSSPLRLNGTVNNVAGNYAYVDGNNLLVYIGYQGEGLHIMTNANNLNLTPETNKYELTIKGTVHTAKGSGSGHQIRVNPMDGSTSKGNTEFTDSQIAITDEVGAPFVIVGELPAYAFTSLRFTVSSAAAGMTFAISDIKIKDLGPR
ncbi:MAG: bacterial Ig-like domain-containing protein [Treponema sp.]|jgi:hypothetical protein|nr:bacterial Ig-like domain-containing protein [Treponema sp.]